MVTPATEPIALQARINGALAERDRAGAVRMALEAIEAGRITVPCLYEEVLAPVMVGVGKAWQVGAEAVWQEHLATAAVRTIVESLHATVQAAAPAERARGTAVLACPPQEQHDLGLRMLSDRMELAGWRVHYLGADTPADEIVGAAQATGAGTVVLSGSTHYHRTMLRSLVEDLAARLPQVRVLVGGPAFAEACDEWCAGHLIDEAELLGDGA